jgi:hypothetical protein
MVHDGSIVTTLCTILSAHTASQAEIVAIPGACARVLLCKCHLELLLDGIGGARGGLLYPPHSEHSIFEHSQQLPIRT